MYQIYATLWFPYDQFLNQIRWLTEMPSLLLTGNIPQIVMLLINSRDRACQYDHQRGQCCLMCFIPIVIRPLFMTPLCSVHLIWKFGARLGLPVDKRCYLLVCTLSHILYMVVHLSQIFWFVFLTGFLRFVWLFVILVNHFHRHVSKS
jgi:hypothetical protein